MSRGRILIAAVAAAVVAVLVVLLVAGGDDETAVREPPKTVGTTRDKPPPAPPKTDTARSTRTVPKPKTTPPEVLTNGSRRDVARAVAGLVQAVELGDGNNFCKLVGQSAGDADGVEALRACGRKAGIDPFRLPTSDEFSVSKVAVQGSRATATLGGGQTVKLERVGGRWQIRSFRP